MATIATAMSIQYWTWMPKTLNPSTSICTVAFPGAEVTRQPENILFIYPRPPQLAASFEAALVVESAGPPYREHQTSIVRFRSAMIMVRNGLDRLRRHRRKESIESAYRLLLV